MMEAAQALQWTPPQLALALVLTLAPIAYLADRLGTDDETLSE